MTGQNYIHKMTAVFITLLMICSCIGSTNVFAAVKPIFEINSNVFNKSAISAEEIYLGESIKLTGKAALLDTKKCKYSYLSKYENQSWTTMQDFTSSSSYTWKPKSVGKYRICIKVLSPSNAVYKKMFNLEVKPKLENQSIISASHIKEDDIITLVGNAAGGTPDYQYEFYFKEKNSDKWQILSSFGKAETISWMPQKTGEFEICIKAADKKSKTVDKYFDLIVDSEKPSSAEYLLYVKTSLFAPYQWSCELGDEDIISVSKPTALEEYDFANAATVLVYRIKTLSAGSSTLSLHYRSYHGEDYYLKYDITVDRSLNMEVNSSEGEYFVKKIPEINQVKQDFSITVEDTISDGKWQCEVSDANVIETEASENADGIITYNFNALRSGYASIDLMCKSKSGTVIIYYLVYNIYVDENLDITTESVDGYYMENSGLPQIKIE